MASDGYALAYRHWRVTERPAGWVLALHGIQSHSGWYVTSSRYLAEHGLEVRFPDRRGSGQNQQQRGHASHWQRLTADALHFLKDIHRERARTNSQAPVHLIGISWGGKLALALARLYPHLIQSLTLITPGVFPRIRPSFSDRSRLKLAGWRGLHARPVRIPLNDPELFTSLPEHQEAIRQDALALHEVTVSFLLASCSLDAFARQTRPLGVPLNLMLAEQDRIIDNRLTRRYFERIADCGCRVSEYPQSWHTLELDICRERFLGDLANWLAPAVAENQPSASEGELSQMA